MMLMKTMIAIAAGIENDDGVWDDYYFVPKELPTKSYPKITQNAAKKAGKNGARSAPFC